MLTADYSFLSYYPYYGFQGLTSHYANPLAQFDKRADAIESWATLTNADQFIDSLDKLPWKPPTVFLMRRGAERHLHAAAGLRRLPQPAQRPPLPRRAGRRAVRRPALRRVRHRAVRAGHPDTDPSDLRPITIKPRDRDWAPGQPPDRAHHRHRRRSARRGAGDRHAPAAGHADHRAAELAAERRAAERQRAADRIRGHRPNITVPCSAAAGLAGPQNRGRTVLLSTVPKQAPKAVDRGLLIERVNNDLLVIVRNTPVVSAPLNQVLSPACQAADVHRARRQGDRRIRRPGAGSPDDRRSRRSRCAASAAATTSGRRSSASSPICPGPRRRAWSSRPPSTPATAARRRC